MRMTFLWGGMRRMLSISLRTEAFSSSEKRYLLLERWVGGWVTFYLWGGMRRTLSISLRTDAFSS